MSQETGMATGAMLDGFHAWVALWIWVAAVLLYGLAYRSVAQPDPDPIRPSGPIDP